MNKDIRIIEAELPPNILGIQYMKNSHYVKITYLDKTVETLWAKRVQQGKCPKCSWTIYTETYLEDMLCPKCQTKMEWTWGETKLSFLPNGADKD